MLLFEITAFLRDSYRRLPRSNHVSVRSNDNAGKTPGATNAGSLNVASGGSATDRSTIAATTPSGAMPPSTSGGESMFQNPGSGSLALVNASTPAGQGPGGRRWSMALSSMGQSQTSAQSLQSITGDGHSVGGVPTGERKISFVLHEPDDESLDSSNTTLTFQVSRL